MINQLKAGSGGQVRMSKCEGSVKALLTAIGLNDVASHRRPGHRRHYSAAPARMGSKALARRCPRVGHKRHRNGPNDNHGCMTELDHEGHC